MGSPMVSIVIAEDHPIFRSGLRKLLESERDLRVTGEAADGEQAVALVPKLQPDLLLLDINLPRLDGFEVLRRLSGAQLKTRTIILAAVIRKPEAVEMLQLGARGLVRKEAAAEMVLRAIRRVMAGEFWVDRETMAEWAASSGKPKGTFGLTPRELEIISEVLHGGTNKDIANKLLLSEETVKRHLSNIYQKLEVSNRLDLVLFALDHDLAPQRRSA